MEGHPQPHREFKVSQESATPCLKIKEQVSNIWPKWNHAPPLKAQEFLKERQKDCESKSGEGS